MDPGSQEGDLNHYIVSFASIINADDPLNIKAHTVLENFAFIGSLTQYFEELMGEKDRLPKSADGVLGRIQLVKRYNPQRHIRIYGVKTLFEEEWFYTFCRDNPIEAEMSIRNTSVEL